MKDIWRKSFPNLGKLKGLRLSWTPSQASPEDLDSLLMRQVNLLIRPLRKCIEEKLKDELLLWKCPEEANQE